MQAGFKGAQLTQQQVDWICGDIITYFKFLDFKKNFKIDLSAVGKMYIVCALLHNARDCLYGNTSSTYFDCEPPTVEEYLVKIFLHEKLILLTHLHPVLLGT